MGDIGNAAMGRGLDGGPIVTHMEGVGKLANTLVGAWLKKKEGMALDAQEAERRANLTAANDALGAGDEEGFRKNLGMYDPEMLLKYQLAEREAQRNAMAGPEWEDVRDAQGKLVAQRHRGTGQYRPISGVSRETWSDVKDENGNVVGQVSSSGKRTWRRSGTNISFDENGMPVVSMGNEMGQDPYQFGTNAARTQLEKNVLDTDEQLMRLVRLQDNVEDDFLRYGGQLRGDYLAFKDKFGELAPEEQDYLTRYSEFRLRAWDNANRYIKFITGAQMSEAEAQRIMRAVPRPPKSPFDGDSPTQFRAKLRAQINDLQMAKARYLYLLRQGYSDEDIRKAIAADPSQDGVLGMSLDGMRNKIEEFGRGREAELREQNPDATDQEIIRQVDAEIEERFGVRFN